MNLGFYLQNGYKLVSESETTYTVSKKQSVLLHVLFFMFTAGIGNILYYFLASGKTITFNKDSK